MSHAAAADVHHRAESPTDARSMTHGRDEPTPLHRQLFALLERMPRLELSEDGHAAATMVARQLFTVIFIIASVHTVQGALRDYRHARAIFRDHGIATAVRDDAVGTFSFVVDGARYSASVEGDEPSVQVAYARGQPDRCGRVEVIERNSSLFHLALWIAIVVPAIALACRAGFTLLTRFVFRVRSWSDHYRRLRE